MVPKKTEEEEEEGNVDVEIMHGLALGSPDCLIASLMKLGFQSNRAQMGRLFQCSQGPVVGIRRQKERLWRSPCCSLEHVEHGTWNMEAKSMERFIRDLYRMTAISLSLSLCCSLPARGWRGMGRLNGARSLLRLLRATGKKRIRKRMGAREMSDEQTNRMEEGKNR